MTHDNPDNIYYIEGKDIEGSSVPCLKGMKAVVMVKASFCGHCQTATPAFKKAAKKAAGGPVAFIICNSDGKPGEEEAGKKLDSIVGIPGVPAYLSYQGGKFQQLNTDRSEESLLGIAAQLSQ
jgi:thiol-disulfide isomerase/thioredoxin